MGERRGRDMGSKGPQTSAKQSRKRDESPDPRIDFICDHISRSLKVKQEKWNKFLDVEERKIFNKYFDEPENPVLLLYQNVGGALSVSMQFPSKYKGKLIYFLRMKPEVITKKNFREIWTVGEMSDDVIQELSMLADELIGPLLCNPANQKGWPKIVVDDMRKHVNDLRAVLYELRGEMANQVLLALPSGIEGIYDAKSKYDASGGEEVDLFLKTNIEGAVIKWMQQISDVLKEDSLSVFKRTKFPLPMMDVQFYVKRLRNLEGIYSQLRDPRIKRMAQYLEMSNSVYLECFKKMLTNVIAVVVETRDIVLYQKPLIKHFEEFEAAEFLDSKHLIKPMLHCVGLLWGNSRHYATAEKIIPLLRAICNLVIQQSSISLNPTSIFQGEPEEKLLDIRINLEIVNHLIECYEWVRDRISTYFPEGVTPVRWSFDFERVFQRLNTYVKRLEMIEEIILATCEFAKLEKVEFSGMRGKTLSNEATKIMNIYMQHYEELSAATYDPADPEDPSFIKDYDQHMQHVRSTDRRLATIFLQGFEECVNLEQIFKYLQIIGDLYYRPIIKQELQPEMPKLIKLMHQNLDTVKLIFDDAMKKYREGDLSVLDEYLPPVAGMIGFIHKLRSRIEPMLIEFNVLDDPIVDSEDVFYMKEKHLEIMVILQETQDSTLSLWYQNVPETCSRYLNYNLLYRDPPNVRLNFHPELEQMLREIKYLGYLDIEDIPEEGKKLYDRNELLQNEKRKLSRAIGWYNEMRQGSHHTEVAMIAKEIAEIDELLKKGIDELNWNDDASEWITIVYDAMDALQKRVLTAQNNVNNALAHMVAWGEKPLYSRVRDGNKAQLLSLKERAPRFYIRKKLVLKSYDEFKETLQNNYKLYFNIKDDEISDDEDEKIEELDESLLDEQELEEYKQKKEDLFAKKEARKMIREQKRAEKEEAYAQKIERRQRRHEKEIAREERRQKLLAKGETVEEELEPSTEDKADMEEEQREIEIEQFRQRTWPPYVDYIDTLISNQIMKAIKTSLDYFDIQTEEENGPRLPFLQVIVELQEPEVVFSPSLDINDAGGLYETITEMMKDMFTQAAIFPRINEACGLTSYEDDVANETELIKKYHKIQDKLEKAISGVLDFIKCYLPYSHLWLLSRREALNCFLKYGRILSPEDFDELYAEHEGDIPEKKPSLDDYKYEIKRYNDLYEECAKLSSEHLVNGWLKLDLRRLNQAIMNAVCKWSHMFKQNLVEHVKQSIADLETFIEYATRELSVQLKEEDYEGLLKVMAVLAEIRDKQNAGTEHFFEPLFDIMNMLRDFGVVFDYEVYEQLDILPDRWYELVKLSILVRSEVSPLQAKHATMISRRVTLFNLRSQHYRDAFLKKSIFTAACTNPYEEIDMANKELNDFENSLEELNKSCKLFDIQPADVKHLKNCRRDLKMIKQLWDYYFLVMKTIDHWKTSPWNKIDVEGMDTESKRLAKDVRLLDKEVRQWEPYGVIESTIKNLLTSLRAVTDLQNPSIKDRHWIELMQATKGSPLISSHIETSHSLDLDGISSNNNSLNSIDHYSKHLNNRDNSHIDNKISDFDYNFETFGSENKILSPHNCLVDDILQDFKSLENENAGNVFESNITISATEDSNHELGEYNSNTNEETVERKNVLSQETTFIVQDFRRQKSQECTSGQKLRKFRNCSFRKQKRACDDGLNKSKDADHPAILTENII